MNIPILVNGVNHRKVVGFKVWFLDEADMVP